MQNKNIIEQPFSRNIIYIYSIPGEFHSGRLKIGLATTNILNPSQNDIEKSAHLRIKNQTITSDTPYKLEHAQIAITNHGDAFKDGDVHNILIRSGIERKSENVRNGRSEWFEIDLETAKKAIQAAKECKSALDIGAINVTSSTNAFAFRPNQLDAIEKTSLAIRSNKNKFLWNAKMRFGKTTAALQVVKKNNLQKVLIVTHRPSVSEDWFNDFKKIFNDETDKYKYASRQRGSTLDEVLNGEDPFIYFASIQDLRGRENERNNKVFSTNWDMFIVDEAHEGTQTNLGDATLQKLINSTKFTLQLSGTPFNILHKHEENEIYTWDYVMEQEEKVEWDKRNPGVPNPYSELPELNIFTFDIDTFSGQVGLTKDFLDELDGAFKFHEFFRVHKDENGNDTDEFIHKDKVRKFLDLLVDDKLQTKFPYATEEYKNYNKHSLWHLPNRVKVIEAMEKLLRNHPIFGEGFGIVNISGDNKDEENDKDAKEKVTNAIKKYDYTITLTGQRLTTGASIPEWTAIFMLSDVTSATTYLQTAFRCQTPANIDGKIKTKGYIFDFAPDRTLKLIAEVIELSHKSGKINTPEQKEAMKKFLNFCPIISSKNGVMREYDVPTMLSQLKKAIIQRVSQNGFDDPKLYNDELLKLNDLDINEFNKLKPIVGSSTGDRINEIVINNLGMDELQIQKGEEVENKKKKELTEEEKERLKKLKDARENKKKAISILRGVSIRMPMLVYGADFPFKKDIDLNTFIDIVDEESWNEFMPEGLTKEQFKFFTKFYDEEVFKGVTHSIRAKALDCDSLLPKERIIAISNIFSNFRNPDKETVLTPWKVVNKHLTLAFGGHDFNNIVNDSPEWLSKDLDTSVWEDKDTKILEINSKSGLYPLLVAFNIYSRKLRDLKGIYEEDVYKELWGKVLQENIFVLCKTPMAKSITFRTIAGYNKNYKTNIVYIEDLVKKLQNINEFRNYNLKDELYAKFNLGNNDMKFTAIVGNPPYQDKTIGASTQMLPIYHLFMNVAYKLSDKVTLITPARFLFNAGATPHEWNRKMLEDSSLKILYYSQKSSQIFPNTDIKGGVAITLRDLNKKFEPINTFTPYPELSSILKKVSTKLDSKLSDIIYSVSIFQFTELLHNENEWVKPLLSEGNEYDISTNAFDVLPKIFEAELPKNTTDTYIKFYGLADKKRAYRWVKSKYIKPHKILYKYKVWVAKANGSGELGEVLSNPIIGEPDIGTTASFISIGCFDSKLEAENTLKYIKTKFSRSLLGVLKITQDNPPGKWSKIPLQDFTDKSDIDWTKSITEIDQQLYKKYNLDQNEIEFIEKNVKPMM